MAFVAPFMTGLTAAATSGAGIMSSLGAASALAGTGTAAGIGAGAGMALGTLGTGTGLAAIGTGLSALGSIRQGQAASAAANYNAQIAERSAVQKEQIQRTAAQRQIGAIRAGIAKSGARTEGTPLMVLAESAANAEIDALNTRYSGQMEASLSRSRGRNDRRAAYWNAGTSLLTSASRNF
jgi:hypothetical protein